MHLIELEISVMELDICLNLLSNIELYMRLVCIYFWLDLDMNLI